MSDATWRRHGAIITAFWTAVTMWSYQTFEAVAPVFAAAAVFTALYLLTGVIADD